MRNYFKVILAAILRRPIIAYNTFPPGYCPPPLSTCQKCSPYFCRCQD